MILEDQVKQAQ
jgi:coiled-coil domain-containing protein 63/114